MHNISILLLEDDQVIADAVQFRLETDGYQVTHMQTCREALETLRSGSYQFAIFDVGLPDGSGFELCKEVRSFSDLPILFLTARSEEIDRVVGLEIGADDYMTKPFSPRELLARIKAILRRSGVSSATNAPAQETDSTFSVNTASCQISYHNTPLTLTKAEYKLLLTLSQNAGRVLSRNQLLEHISDDPGASLDRVIDAHVKSIRAKLKAIAPEGAELIETRRGLGYSFKQP